MRHFLTKGQALATTVTQSNWEQEVIQSDKPVIVDFWAEWCGPCHAVAPVLDKIVDERPEYKLVKVNIDEEQALAQKYGIASIPTMILFKDGEPAAAAVGAQPKGALERSLGIAEGSALAYPSTAYPFAASSFSSVTGIAARCAGSSGRLRTRMPCTNVIAPPSQPPTLSRPKPASVSTNGRVSSAPFR